MKSSADIILQLLLLSLATFSIHPSLSSEPTPAPPILQLTLEEAWAQAEPQIV